jgi:predicted  nucleic acid-binding Zn-ribbon protein
MLFLLVQGNRMAQRTVQITKKGLPSKKSGIRLDDQLFFTLEKRWKDLFKKWLDVQHKCVRCGTIYNEIENIGSWECKQHVLSWNAHCRGSFYGAHSWDCCGDTFPSNLTDHPRGCVPCDHNTLDFPYQAPEHDVVLPTVLLQYLITGGTSQEAILADNDLKDYVADTGPLPPDLSVVRRFKWLEYRSRKERGTSAEGVTRAFGHWMNKKDLGWYGI